jgi:hypothetical protein
MTKKSTLLLLVVLTFLIGLVVYVAINIKEEKSRSMLLTRTQNAISDYRRGAKPNIDFSATAHFSWERMYIFGPYSACSRINDTIGFNWLGCKNTGIEYYENGSLFIFVEKKRVVQYMVFDGIFTETNSAEGFSFQEAHFIVDEEGIIRWAYEK